MEKIDNSYWLMKDKIWMAEREADWLSIEKTIAVGRRKSELNVIKQYFMRGKLPKWEKYQSWEFNDRHERPLDLMLFLWLHPSSDMEVLRSLYRTYMESSAVHINDITVGYGRFLEHEFISSTSPYPSLEEYPFLFLGGKNIILFRVFFEDADFARQHTMRLARLTSTEQFNKEFGHFFRSSGYLEFLQIKKWLLQKDNCPLMLNCLYQYEDVLEWCFATFPNDSEQKFLESISKEVNLINYQKALYCIHHFDIEKEGDTGRSRGIKKVRQLLNEGNFTPEFKTMWEDTKAGKIEVKDPWERR